MGFEGDIFTWRRGKIRERLDRTVCNPRWADMFPIEGVVNEDFGKSDHRPILVYTEPVESIIQTAWDKAKLIHAEASLSDHTTEVHEALHSWDKNVLKGPRRRLRELQAKLNRVMSGPLSDEAISK
jgi:hypothetical protein